MATPPTSVLLPTVRWTGACDEVAAQLGPADELLVVCDGPDDPVANRESVPQGVRVVQAGEPSGCSGKANAIAAGMAAARHDRLVWTDDDFHHPPDWLDGMHADYERYGPVSELPVFVGRDPLAVLVEPIYVLGGTVGVYSEQKAWGGAVIFERDDLAGGEERFLADLRRTVSDDGLLSERLDVTTLRRTRRVGVGGSLRETLERQARFAQITWRHEPGSTVLLNLLTVLVAAGVLLYPLVGSGVLAALYAAMYARFGVRRPSFLLAGPATVAWPVLFAYGLARRTFVWGGRRYRWRSKFDVEVLS